MRRSWPLTALLFSFLVLLPACSRAPLPDPDSPAPPVENPGAPVTEAEARTFADQLVKALKAGDAAQVDRLLHMDNLLERLVSDFGLSGGDRDNFLRGARAGMRQRTFGHQLQQVLADGGSYKLLRVRIVAGQTRALFRMLSPEGAVNYHDFILVRFPDGVGMEDVYIHLIGEQISQTMRRLIIPLVAQARQGVHLRGVDEGYLKSIKSFGAMTQAVQQKQFAQVAMHYRALPQKLQENKAVLVVYMQGLMQQEGAGEKEYLEAMEKFRKLYPNDAAIDFISIDYHFVKKQFDEAIAAVDRLDKVIGGDPYLDAVRANALVEAKRYDKARVAAERAIKAEPTLHLAYGSRLLVSLRERKFAETLEWLKKMVETCQVQMDNLEAIPDYAEFVRSPQYREWQQWYAARGKR